MSNTTSPPAGWRVILAAIGTKRQDWAIGVLCAVKRTQKHTSASLLAALPAYFEAQNLTALDSECETRQRVKDLLEVIQEYPIEAKSLARMVLQNGGRLHGWIHRKA